MTKILLLAAFTLTTAQIPQPKIPLPPIKGSLTSVCFSDSVFLPYYALLLDSLKKMDTTHALDSATVVPKCDTLLVVVPVMGIRLPVFMVVKMNACSLGLRMVLSRTAQIRDSVINLCALLPVRQGVSDLGPHVAAPWMERSDGAYVLRYAGNGPATGRIATAGGRTVATMNGSDGRIVWNARHLPPGLYVWTLHAGGMVRSVNFLK